MKKARKAAGAYGASTRNVVEDDGGLSRATITADLKNKRVGDKQPLTNPKLDAMAVDKKDGDGKTTANGLTLDYTLVVSGDGDRKIEVYRYSKPKDDARDAHFAMRDNITPELLKGNVP